MRKKEKKRRKQKGDKKKGRSKVEPPQWARKGVRGWELLTTTTDLTMSSDVRSAQSLCRCGGPSDDEVQQQVGEEESKRAQRSMCCPFIGALAHAQSVSAKVRFVPYVLPT